MTRLFSEKRRIYLELEDSLDSFHVARYYVLSELTPANPKAGMRIYQVMRGLFKAERDLLDTWVPIKRDKELGIKDLR